MLETVICVVGMFYKPEFKRRNRDELEGDGQRGTRSFSMFSQCSDSLWVKPSAACRRLKNQRAQSEGSPVQ